MSERFDNLISHFERLVRRDPAQRGLIGADGSGPGRGELVPAARLFAEHSGAKGSVGILTGFFVPLGRPEIDVSPEDASVDVRERPISGAAGRAETDGPPGAAVLAAVLAELGFSPLIITDELCQDVATEAARSAGLSAESVVACPIAEDAAAAWLRSFKSSGWARQMTHLVSVERVGPSHHNDSIRQNDPEAHVSGEFLRNVPESAFDRCFNMRGETIDHVTASLHRLFQSDEAADARLTDGQRGSGDAPATEERDRPAPFTIGVGDGGNEIGMGRFAWSHLRERIRGQAADRIPCRVAAERTIVAGTSNLGAYALAASIAVVHERVDVLTPHTCASQHRILERMVEHAGAVDGVTKVAEPTVDGVPFLTGIQPWAAIRRALALAE